MSLLVRRRHKPAINIVPLMDVLTILIFFFLVSMQFKETTTLNLTLPEIETAGKNEFPDKIDIAIDNEQQIFLQGKVVELEALGALISALADVNDEIPVLIKVHFDTPFQLVADVMDEVRGNGLNKIRLQGR